MKNLNRSADNFLNTKQCRHFSMLSKECPKAACLAASAQVDVKSTGKTALQVASHQGYLDIVQLLLKAGANIQLQDEDGDTALHYSAFGY